MQKSTPVVPRWVGLVVLAGIRVLLDFAIMESVRMSFRLDLARLNENKATPGRCQVHV
jgi:hypothetical protein